MGRNFIDMVQKSFLQYVYFCILQNNIINFLGIASHITFTFPSHYSIHFHVYMPISVYIFIFLHILCLGMIGIDSGWRDMAWQMSPLIFDWQVQWHFNQVDTTLRIWHSTKLTFMPDVWVLLHFREYFTKIRMHNIIFIIYIPLFHKNVIYVN